MTDEQQQALVDAILAKPVSELTPMEAAFVRQQVQVAVNQPAPEKAWPGLPPGTPAKTQANALEMRAEHLMNTAKWSPDDAEFMGRYIAQRAREMGY